MDKFNKILYSLAFGFGTSIVLFLIVYLIASFIKFDLILDVVIERYTEILRAITLVGLMLSIVAFIALKEN